MIGCAGVRENHLAIDKEINGHDTDVVGRIAVIVMVLP